MLTRFLRRCICLAAMLCGAIWCGDATQDPRCPIDLPHTAALLVHADACYQFVDVEKYWTEARDFCQHWGGRLVKVDDAATGEFVVSTLNALPWKSNGVWIGLHDRGKELHWQWTGPGPNTNEDGLHWSNWGSGHPKAFLHSQRDCVRMVRGKGEWKWHETPCALLKWHYRFICEYKMKPTLPPPQPPPVPSRFFHLDSAHNRRITETPPGPPSSPQPPPSTKAPSSAGGEVRRSEGIHWGLRGDVTKSVEKTVESTSVEDRVLYADGMGYVLQMKSDEEKQESNGGRMAAAVSVTMFGVAVLLLIIFLLYRRRRQMEDKLSTVSVTVVECGSSKEKHTMLKGDMEDDEEEGGKGEKTPRPFWTKLMRAPPLVAMATKRPSPPAQNTYVDAPLRAAVQPRLERNADNNDSNPIGGRGCQSKLPALPTASGPAYGPQVGGESMQSRSEKGRGGKNASGEEGKETEKTDGQGKFLIDCDTADYDSPKPANVYAEIPGQELEQEEGDECHIYECLDDMKARVKTSQSPLGGDADVVA